MIPSLPEQSAGGLVAVIILTCDQRDITLRCLEALDTSSPRWRVVLWDNGSTDGTATCVRERFPGVVFHHSAENLGVAGGRNAAAAFAVRSLSPEYLFFLDNDTVITPGIVDALAAPFESDIGLGQTAPKLRMLNDPDRIDVAGGCVIRLWRGGTRPVGHGELDRGQHDTPGPCIPAGCMMVRTSLFQRLGGFELAFNPYGPEDLDFSLRARTAGYRAAYVPKALIYHDRSQTFEGGRYSERYAWQKARLLRQFVKRHASPVEYAAFMLAGAPFRVLAIAFREMRRGNFGAVRGAVRGAFGRSRSNSGA